MVIEPISSKYQFYNYILEYKINGKLRFINYQPSEDKRKVTFKLDKTYQIDCNPLTIEDDIIKYLKNKT